MAARSVNRRQPFHDAQRDEPGDLARKPGAVSGLDDGVDVLVR